MKTKTQKNKQIVADKTPKTIDPAVAAAQEALKKAKAEAKAKKMQESGAKNLAKKVKYAEDCLLWATKAKAKYQKLTAGAEMAIGYLGTFEEKHQIKDRKSEALLRELRKIES